MRNAVAGQLEFTIGDIPEFDSEYHYPSSTDGASLYQIQLIHHHSGPLLCIAIEVCYYHYPLYQYLYLPSVPGSRPLKIPVVSGEMEELVFAPRLEAKDDDDVWKRVTDGGKVEMVKVMREP